MSLKQIVSQLLEADFKPDSQIDEVNSFISSVGLDSRSCRHRSSIRDSSGLGDRHGRGFGSDALGVWPSRTSVCLVVKMEGITALR